MTETAKKAPAKTKTEKPAAKTAKPARLAAGEKGTVTITQMIGSIARQGDQLATLKGLGLGKRHRTRTLKDSPEVRGMIYKVRHLVKVEG